MNENITPFDLGSISVNKNFSIENLFLDIQADMLKIIFGPQPASLTDYYEAGGSLGLMGQASLKPVAEYLFMTSQVLTSKIAKKGQTYYVSPDVEWQKNNPDITKIIAENYRIYNPDSLYCVILWPNSVGAQTDLQLPSGQDSEQHNFFLLKKSCLDEQEINNILQRASLAREVFAYSSNYYDYENHFARTGNRMFHSDPWIDLRKQIERLMIRLDPSLSFDYARRANVLNWSDGDESGFNNRGYLAEDLQDKKKIKLTNVWKDKHSYLKGKQIIYLPVEESGYEMHGHILAEM